MAIQIADRVKETTTTTGTGALALAGAVPGFRAFSAVCAVGDLCSYSLQAVDGSGNPTGAWEVGVGIYSAASTLTRSTILASSNAGAAVNLPAGTTQVWLDLPAASVAALVGKSRIINGSMDIAVRALTFTGNPANYQTLDRFSCNMVSGSGHTVAQVADAPLGFVNSMKVTVGTGAAQAATDFSFIRHSIEAYNVLDFAYGTVNARAGTLSFWVKGSIVGTYALSFVNGPVRNRSYVTTYTINNANTWEYKTVTFTGDLTGTWGVGTQLGLQIGWDLGVGSNYIAASANTWTGAELYGLATTTKLVATSGATFQLTGVQFEMGSLATPFERRPIGLEQFLCKRYFEAGTLYMQSPAANTMGTTISMVQKRAAPSMVALSTTYTNGNGLSLANSIQTDKFGASFNATAAGSGFVNSSWQASCEI